MAQHVQTVFNSNGSASSISVTITLTAGNMVIVIPIWGDVGLGSLGTISQTSGDTLTATDAEIDNSGTFQRQYVAHSVTGGSTTFTLSWTGGATRVGMFVVELSGMITSTAFDKFASSALATGTTQSSGTTGSLSQADEVAIATFNGNASGGATTSGVSNGFTVPTNGDQMLGSGTSQYCVLAYKVTTTTSPVETTLTTNDNFSSTGLVGTYKAQVSNPRSDGLIVIRGTGA